MDAQTPAEGISLSSTYKDSKCYKISCMCHSGDHDVDMWIEVDKDNEDEPNRQEVTLTFYVNTTTPFWKKGFSRVKAAWDILVNGYREDAHGLILSQQGALNLAAAINSSVEELIKPIKKSTNKGK